MAALTSLGLGRKKMKKFTFVLLSIIISTSIAGCGTSSSASSEDTNSFSSSSEEEQKKEAEDVSKENNVAYNVNWDKCLDDLKESVLNQEFYPYARDVYVGVDEDQKQINFTAILDDSTDPSVALEYADTIIRQYNLMANMQDSNIALGGKDYYGGLYDQYSILIGIAPQSKVEDIKEWFVFDAVVAGAYQTIDLQKAYQ